MVIKFWKHPCNTKPLPLTLQIREMKRLFPLLRVTKQSINSVIWEGPLQVDFTFPKYSVRIEYTRLERPKVFVLEPELQSLPNQRIPHLYRKGKYNKADNLCLYLPNTNEFTHQHFIARTIIPWALHWLFCYDIWKLTGTWVGGGKHLK